MRRLISIITICSMVCSFCYAQKALQYEKGGSLKTLKFYIGDEIKFKIKSANDIWYTRIIYDIDVDKNTILIENTADENPIQLPITDITHIRIKNRNKLGRLLGQVLFVGGINTILTTFALSRRDIIPSFKEDPDPLIYGGAGTIIGFAIWRLFSREGIKLNQRKRLRLIDTTLYLPA